MRQLPLPISTDEAVMAVWSSWSEDTLQSYVLRTARLCGWLAYHTRFSIKSAAGFPDLVLVKESRLIFAELKRQGLWPTEGRLSKGAVPHWLNGQREWLLALSETPAEVYLWWPSDSHDISVILSQDARPADATMECVTRTKEYLGDAAGEAGLPHGSAAAGAVEPPKRARPRPEGVAVVGAGRPRALARGADPGDPAGQTPGRRRALLGVDRPR